MKRLFLFQIIMMIAMVCPSCSTDQGIDGGDSPSVNVVPLSYELSTYATSRGGEVEVIFKVTSEAVTEESVVLSLSALSGTEDVSSTYFVDFPSSITFPEGKSEFTQTLTLKSDFNIESTYNAIELQVFTRGYSISGGTAAASGAQSHTIRIYDQFVTDVVLKGNATEVKEGETFSLVASIPVASEEDVVVSVAYSGDDFEFTNLPESITIAAGETSAESTVVTVEVDEIYTGDINVEISISTTSEDFPLSQSTVAFKVKDIDTPLGDETQDERHVYNDPSIMFVSSGNKSAVDAWGKTKYVEMAKGDAHPNETLGSTWKFYTSLEFHNIPACYTEYAEYDTKLAKGLAAQNTVLWESVAAVENTRFSTITDDGNLNMWVMKIASTTTGTAGQSRDYGSSAFYLSKFSSNQDDASNCWATNLVRILPGTRVETRAKLTGQKKGMNMAIWLQGNAFNSLDWPLYGEVDVLENPASESTSNIAHFTYHMGNQSSSPSTYKNPTASTTISDMTDYNIYWFEFIDDSTLAIGVNGKEMKRISKSDYSGIWPFDMTTNPYGLHYLLTMGVGSEWAISSLYDGWDSGFSSYTNYTEDRFNAELPRMEIDWIRFYTASNYDDSGNVSSLKLY